LISALSRFAFAQNEKDEEQKNDRNSRKPNFASCFLLSFGLLATRIKDEDREKTSKNNSETSKNNFEMSRFLSFASIEVDGEICMTPRDFLDSVIQDHPRSISFLSNILIRKLFFKLESDLFKKII